MIGFQSISFPPLQGYYKRVGIVCARIKIDKWAFFLGKCPPMSKPKSKTISVTDAAAVLGVGRSRVLALIKAGRLPAVKVSTIWTIQEKDLEKVKVRKPGRPPKTKGPAKPARKP